MINITGITTVSVSQINAYIKKIIDSNGAISNFWIRGEISNFKHHISGHMYITLKDENSVLKAVMFKTYTSSLNFVPKDGMMIIARGRVGVYEASGTYQMYIEEMYESGTGDLQIKFEKLKKKLEEEGLFDKDRKKEIPDMPSRIGVCTATGGAAVKDIINVATRRFPLAEIIIYPTIVQGDLAANSICNAIEWFNRNNAADVLIVGRGGGSIEDLWAFNEENVAYSIYNSNIPIISAIGHETDFTIADFVSDLRAPTPSAAAELAVPDMNEIYSRIAVSEKNLIKRIHEKIDYLRLLTDKTLPPSPREVINYSATRLKLITDILINNYNNKINSYSNSLGNLIVSLNNLSPINVMARGYTLAFNTEGAIIKSSLDMNKGDSFVLKFHDGEKKCSVDD